MVSTLTNLANTPPDSTAPKKIDSRNYLTEEPEIGNPASSNVDKNGPAKETDWTQMANSIFDDIFKHLETNENKRT